MALVDTNGPACTLKQHKGCDTNWQRKEIYRYICTIKPIQISSTMHSWSKSLPYFDSQNTIKQQNHPNSLPRDTQRLLMSKLCSAHSYTDEAGSPASMWSSCALWWEVQPEHPLLLLRGLGSGMGKRWQGSHYTMETLLGLRPGLSQGAEGAGCRTLPLEAALNIIPSDG